MVNVEGWQLSSATVAVLYVYTVGFIRVANYNYYTYVPLWISMVFDCAGRDGRN